MIYLLFFLSGLSGLIYQVVWVRVFGNVFGNTIYSASIVVAVFMLGLGVGSYVIGRWADRRYISRPESSLLRTYAQVEIVIAALGFGIAVVLPHLGALSAALSSYVREPSGWYALSAASYVWRTAAAIVLLTPITLLMGGTLTLLIRHLVRSDLALGGWHIALLYGVNTGGAALGALLTDFVLVPGAGLWGTQMVAVAFNVIAGAGAWYLAGRAVTSRLKPAPTTHRRRGRLPASAEGSGEARRSASDARRRQPAQPVVGVGFSRPDFNRPDFNRPDRAVVLTSLALAMIGLAALGMEILWFRHFNILLGGFRAVFSLLLTLILLGIGVGALVGGAIHRRTGRPVEWLMMAQGVFVASTLFGLANADVTAINTDPTGSPPPGAPPGVGAEAVGPLAELWFNAQPMLLEMALPALLMGFSFPLANAIVQRAEQSVGRRAGVLYLANTIGAVCGSLLAGFVLLPALGLQQGATVLMTIAALAIVPLFFAAMAVGRAFTARQARREAAPYVRPFIAAIVVAFGALGGWLLLPADYIVRRTLGPPPPAETRLLVSDGLTELIAITERPGQGRTLHTNGHAMSSTQPLSQRYMRALAHIPLLSMEQPETVLVIGFGVGNTTHAATLHPSVARVDLADLSRDILSHAGYFADANHEVLSDPDVVVHINDGRQHLQMQPRGAYDLIVLEPPPIAYAGVSALYSREFYELARSRLEPDGYVSQWLPAYQVPNDTALSMIRAFIEVFPQAVLLSGAGPDLLLLGTTNARIAIDPQRLAARLASAPAVRADLERVSLARPHEIVGTFVGSPRTLADATRSAAPVLDDRPLQEYGVQSMLDVGHGVPADIVDPRGVGEWCPGCFEGGEPVEIVANLDTYLNLLTLAYSAPPVEVAAARRIWEEEGRTILGSAYLGAIVPETAETHIVLGLARAENGRFEEAIQEFRRALQLDPGSADSHWHLGAALASAGNNTEALQHLERSVALDPGNSRALNDLGLMLAIHGRFEEAAAHLERAVALDPGSADARRNLMLVQQRLRAP